MERGVRSLGRVLCLGLVLLLPSVSWANEKGGRGAISGTLVNGTTGERVPGVEVILKPYEGEEEKENLKTSTDAEGRFFFRGLEKDGGKTYILHTIYKAVEYYSSTIQFKEETAEVPYELTVYEPTDSDEKVAVAMHHVLLEPREGRLWVRELMIVENTGNRVYVGSQQVAPDKKETLRISLPSQAEELQILKGLMSCCIVEVQDGFADTMDIKPGRKEIQFSYQVAYRTSNLILPKKITLATSSLDFFIPNRGVRATGENLQYAGLLGRPEQQFLHFTGKKLAKGVQVALNLESLPKGRISLKKVAPVTGVVLLLFGLAYPVIRHARRSGESRGKPEPGTGQDAGSGGEREDLLRAIAELDDRLDAGEISPEEHERKRRFLKERVMELTKAL